MKTYLNNCFKTKIKRASIISLIIITLAFPLPLSGCKGPTQLELSGTLESTQINVNSEVTGKVVEIKKEEGSKAAKDEVIAVIDSSAQELVVKQQEALLKVKKAKLDELAAGARPEQIKQVEAGVRAAEIAVKSAQAGIDTASTNYSYLLEKYNNAKSLHASGNVSDELLSDAKYKLELAAQQLGNSKKQYDAAKEQLNSSKAQLDLLKNGSSKQTLNAAQADMEQAEIILEQARLQLTKYEVKAPAGGTVILNSVSAGDIVSTGANISTISDLSNLWISVYIPQSSLHLVSLGQSLDLKIPAAGDKALKGRITYIASEAEFTPKNTETNEAKQNTVFKLKVKVEENAGALKPGMTADVLIPLESVR